MSTLPASFVNYPEHLVIESNRQCIDCREGPKKNNPKNWVIHTPYGSSHPSHRGCAEKRYSEEIEKTECLQIECFFCNIPIKQDWSRSLPSFSWIREGLKETHFWLFHIDKRNMLRQYKNLTKDRIGVYLLSALTMICFTTIVSHEAVYLSDAIGLTGIVILLGGVIGITKEKKEVKLERLVEAGITILTVSVAGAAGVILGAIKVKTALAGILSTLGYAMGLACGLIDKRLYLTLGLFVAVSAIGLIGVNLPPEERERRSLITPDFDYD